MNDDEVERLRRSVRRAQRRAAKAERERSTVLAQTTYLGTLGVLIALPIVAGAYLGEWLDRRLHGYSVSWTVTCLVLGVAVGAFNAYLFVRERS
jgi:ATP synthase protein I